MKTLEERIEALARALSEHPDRGWVNQEPARRVFWMSKAERLARAFAPELFDGTAWIAPVEVTPKMRAAASETKGMKAVDAAITLAWVHGGGLSEDDATPPPLDQAYAAMRDAFLHPEKAE